MALSETDQCHPCRTDRYATARLRPPVEEWALWTPRTIWVVECKETGLWDPDQGQATNMTPLTQVLGHPNMPLDNKWDPTKWDPNHHKWDHHRRRWVPRDLTRQINTVHRLGLWEVQAEDKDTLDQAQDPQTDSFTRKWDRRHQTTWILGGMAVVLNGTNTLKIAISKNY